MKKYSLVFLLFLFIAAKPAGPSFVYEKSFDVVPGGMLDIKADPGNITVETWDKNECFISVKGFDEDDTDQIKIEKKGNTVYVRTESDGGWKRSINIKLKVPNNFHINANTTGGNVYLEGNLTGRAALHTNGGNVSTRNLQGELSIYSAGGNIKIGDVKGKISVNTNGGNITAGTLTGDKVRLNTMGGNVTAEKVDGNLQLKTYGGTITIGDIGGSASVVTFGGNIVLGKASGNVEANTYGGNIFLDGAEGFVDVNTSGGNISLKNIRGSVKAETSAGNVFVEMYPGSTGESVIETSVGEIELLIGKDSKAVIDARILAHGWWPGIEDDLKIRSDFKADSYDVSKHKGDIHAVYTINGGGHSIKLRTSNSDIKIKKTN